MVQSPGPKLLEFCRARPELRTRSMRSAQRRKDSVNRHPQRVPWRTRAMVIQCRCTGWCSTGSSLY